MAQVHVDDERRIVSPPEAVWPAVSDPVVLVRLDDRLALVSATGEPGTPGSEYVIDARYGRTRRTVRCVVTDAEPARSIACRTFLGDQDAGSQQGTLTDLDGATLLRWRVTVVTPWLTAPLARWLCRRELRRWLDAVERAASGESSA